MDSATVIAGGSAAIALVTAVLTFKSSAQANRANSRKVDLEEHRDAIERLRKIIEEQDRHMERVRLQLDRVQEQLAREQDVSMLLRAQVRALQDQVDVLMRSRSRLEEVLTAAAPGLRIDLHEDQEQRGTKE